MGMIGLRTAVYLPALLATVLLSPSAEGQVSTPRPSLSAPAEATLRRDDLRVARVAYRLALAGTRLCPEKHPLTGLLFHHLAEYELRDRPQMIARHALDRGPGILGVVADSPAARAGLTAGDVLLSVNGESFQPPSRAAALSNPRKWRPMVESDEARLEIQVRRGAADLIVLREGAERHFRLDSLPACLGRIRLARSGQTNAFANGRTVVMTTAMLDFTKSDDELAVVIGHELAHNILRHPVRGRGAMQWLGGPTGKSAVWRREEEADRFGLRLMAAAGYDLQAAIPFWRRYLGKYDWLPQIFRSHPGLEARERIVREELAAIAREGLLRP
jgi:hypothetical protein